MFAADCGRITGYLPNTPRLLPYRSLAERHLPRNCLGNDEVGHPTAAANLSNVILGKRSLNSGHNTDDFPSASAVSILWTIRNASGRRSVRSANRILSFPSQASSRNVSRSESFVGIATILVFVSTFTSPT